MRNPSNVVRDTFWRISPHIGAVYTPRVGWLSRLFSRRYERAQSIAGLETGRVEVSGRVEPLDELVSPLTGQPGVALHYRASTPSATRGAFGELPGHGLRLAMECSQAVDFLLRDESGAALVRVVAGVTSRPSTPIWSIGTGSTCARRHP